RGQFYACWKDRTSKVYVQPAWLNDEEARRVAIDVSYIPIPSKALIAIRRVGEEIVTTEEANRLAKENEQLRSQNAELHRRIGLLERPGPSSLSAIGEILDADMLYERFRVRLLEDLQEPRRLQLLLARPETNQ